MVYCEKVGNRLQVFGGIAMPPSFCVRGRETHRNDTTENHVRRTPKGYVARGLFLTRIQESFDFGFDLDPRVVHAAVGRFEVKRVD